MNFDFVVPAFNDAPSHLWLPAKNKRDGWNVPQTVSELDFLVSLANQLRRAGKKVAFLVTTRRLEESLRSVADGVFFIYEGLERGRRVSSEEAREVERHFGINSLRSFVYPERTYDWGMGEDDLLPRAVHVLRFVERFVDEHRVGCFVNNIGAEVVRRSIGLIAPKRGIGNLIFDFAALPGRFVFANDEMGIVIPPVPSSAPPPEDIEWAKSYVSSMVGTRKPWSAASPLGFGRHNFRGAFAAIAATRYQRDVSVRRLIDDRMRRIVRRAIGTTLWEPMVPGERYVFFPVHLPNDSTITVRSPQFQRQDELLQYVAERALPSGMRLYVKPHIGARDSFTLDFLLKIRRLPNVRLIAPATNPYDIIDGAQMSLVINSTAGFESVLRGKPTMVLGNPWYGRHGLTVDVDRLSDVPAGIERTLAFAPSEDRLLRFLAHYRAFTHEGVYGLTSETNIANMATAILGQSARLQAEPTNGVARGVAAHG